MQRRFEIQPDRGAGAGVELTRHVVVEVAIVGASGTAEDDVLLVAEQVVGEAEPRLDRTGIRITVATGADVVVRSEEHTSELQSLMRISYAVFCLKKTKQQYHNTLQMDLSYRTHKT